MVLGRDQTFDELKYYAQSWIIGEFAIKLIFDPKSLPNYKHPNPSGILEPLYIVCKSDETKNIIYDQFRYHKQTGMFELLQVDQTDEYRANTTFTLGQAYEVISKLIRKKTHHKGDKQ